MQFCTLIQLTGYRVTYNIIQKATKLPLLLYPSTWGGIRQPKCYKYLHLKLEARYLYYALTIHCQFLVS